MDADRDPPDGRDADGPPRIGTRGVVRRHVSDCTASVLGILTLSADRALQWANTEYLTPNTFYLIDLPLQSQLRQLDADIPIGRIVAMDLGEEVDGLVDLTRPLESRGELVS